MAFNAKNLSYELKEPSFLRKLKSQYGGGDAQRHERPIARPKRLRTGDDEDDEPTYVDDETNQTISKDEYLTLVEGSAEQSSHAQEKNQEVDDPKGKPDDSTTTAFGSANGAETKEKLANIGTKRNVRAGKRVATRVGDLDSDDASHATTKDEKEAMDSLGDRKVAVEGKKSKGDIKSKKRKKVKLSFEADETESNDQQ
ncbi:MAG: hypothetical protein M1825_006281 [Sarcosagium campestre]|nr:MAG: hypothetical protein M1825_006281 [Sarcosagium campestre]